MKLIINNDTGTDYSKRFDFVDNQNDTKASILWNSDGWWFAYDDFVEIMIAKTKEDAKSEACCLLESRLEAERNYYNNLLDELEEIELKEDGE